MTTGIWAVHTWHHVVHENRVGFGVTEHVEGDFGGFRRVHREPLFLQERPQCESGGFGIIDEQDVFLGHHFRSPSREAGLSILEVSVSLRKLFSNNRQIAKCTPEFWLGGFRPEIS